MKPILTTAILILFAIQAFAVGAVLADDGANPSVANIQRTLARMAVSTPDDPATVRWMFYGQSITAQPWTRLVEQDLARRFQNLLGDHLKTFPACTSGSTPGCIIPASRNFFLPDEPGLLGARSHHQSRERERPDTWGLGKGT